MKSLFNIKKSLKGIIFKSAGNILSSQTLYESLLACIDLYELTKDNLWKEESRNLCRLLCDFQQDDGGFDIGYNFRFGEDIKKAKNKESTTPEAIGLYALFRYSDVFKDPLPDKNIEKGIKWILGNSYRVSENKYAIPYAPDSVKDVHILNGVSFAIAPLAYYCHRNPGDTRTKEIYDGMILFLKEELEENENYKGMYLRYFYRKGQHFPKGKRRDKIDNYHIGQQLRYHIAAQNLCPNENNLEIITQLAKYLYGIQKDDGIIYYTNLPQFLGSAIHVWGFASCIKGFTEAYKFLGEKEYLDAASKIVRWLLKYSWNGKYFYPVLSDSGEIVDNNFYPRSDAWVIHSIAHYLKIKGLDRKLYEIGKDDFLKIKDAHFRGKENHALTTKKIIYNKLTYLLKRE